MSAARGRERARCCCCCRIIVSARVMVGGGWRRWRRCDEKNTAGRNLLIFFKSLRPPTVVVAVAVAKFNKIFSFFTTRRHIIRASVVYNVIHCAERNFYKRQKKMQLDSLRGGGETV